MSLYKETFLCHIFITVSLAYYQNTSNVTTLTSENFDENLKATEHIWVMQFYSYKSRRCQGFIKEFILGANVLKGIIKFGAVNVENNTDLADNFKIDAKALPLLKIFGILNDGHIDYNGPRTGKDLVDMILTHILEKMKRQFDEVLPENLIEEVSDKNFDQVITNSQEPWLVLFYAPWCIHCEEFKPVWEQAAANLNGRIKFASIDATVNKIKADEYDLKDYPTVKLFPPGKKSPKNVWQYNDDRTSNAVIKWALALLPGPDVVQITNSEVFENSCMTKKLCVISMVPSIFDCQAACRQRYLKILQRLGEKYKDHDWNWMWSEGGVQNELENVLNVGGFGYPALVVLNPSKMKYTVFRGAFTESNINEFLKKLAKAHALGVDEDILQKIVAIEAWNGRDSENELPEELYLHDTEFNRKQEL